MQGPARFKMRGWLPAWAFALPVLAMLIPVLAASPCLAGEIVLPVPRVTLYPGDAIVDSMLVDRSFRSQDFDGPGFVSTREQLVGKVARQTLIPNQPVSTNGVREAHMVKQGQPAVVIFQSGGLIISATAMPLQAGAVGEVISLRNTESGTTIRGVVHADGTVRVGTP
jgi:flagellar basal body P-ring formation protein FlgA